MKGLRLWLWRLADGWWRLRRSAKDRMPYVRRRQWRIAQRKYQELADAVHRGLPAATDAPAQVRKAPGQLSGRVCLFVTHAPRPQLKTHVLHHLDHLLRAGLQVILVVNSDPPLSEVEVPQALSARLAGVIVRANEGFDFAAWGHALALCDRSGWEALYLVNDSIVGPLAPADFDAMMRRIEACDADVVGLTQNPLPMHHLQSYFVVFGRRALHSPQFDAFTRGIRNLADKGQVVDVYEIRMTRSLQAAGFTTHALFAQLPDGRDPGADLLLGHWESLVAAGFPYVKTRVLQARRHPRLAAVRAAGRVDSQI